MILAAGLTPAWQYVLVFDGLRVGEVNRARESRWFASGKAVNVALAVHSLQAPTRLVTFVGGGTGERLVQDVETAGIEADWVTSSQPTRTCTTLIDAAAGCTTELVENSAGVSPQELSRYQRAFARAAEQADVIVLSGSLPAETPRSYYRELLESIPTASSTMGADRSNPSRLVLDIRGPELLDCLAFRPFLVKPNREELATTVGRPLDDDRSLLAAMKELNERGAEWVLVTQGDRPAWLTSRNETCRVHPASGALVVNPIGCGDSVAAGIAVGLHQRRDIASCVSLGLGAAAANLERLECARFSFDRAQELSQTVRVERWGGSGP
jgi:tagatose 6-phosphate kinase